MNKTKFCITTAFWASVLFLLCVSAPPESLGADRGEPKRYTIDEIVSVAVEKNPSLTAFEAGLKVAAGDLVSSGAYPNPEVEFGRSRGEELGGRDSGGEYSVSIGQPFEWPGKRLFRKRSARAAVDAVRYDREAFVLELRYRVKVAFYRMLLAEEEVASARENMTTVNGLLEAVKARVLAGDAPEFELVKARVESLKAARVLREAEKKVYLARARLNSLTGNALEPDFGIKGVFASSDTVYDRRKILGAVLDKHPLVLKGEKEAESRRYALKMERHSVFPDITLKGFYERELDKESYGGGLSLPLPVWYRRKGEITSAAGELARAEAELLKTRVDLARAVDEALGNYQVATDRIRVFDEGLLDQAAEALRIAEMSYREGQSGLIDYLDAQRVYRETLLDYNRARFDLSVAVAEIERLTAGYGR